MVITRISKNLKAVPITGAAYFGIGLNTTYRVRNKAIEFRNKS